MRGTPPALQIAAENLPPYKTLLSDAQPSRVARGIVLSLRQERSSEHEQRLINIVNQP